jgi:DNA polymerase (family 10)
MAKKHRLPNAEVVTILKEALAAMEVAGNVSFFEIRAYQNAVAVLDNLTVSIYDMWENKKLGELPGFGDTLTSHLDELFTTGRVEKFEKVKKGLPEGMFALIGLRSVGAKRAFKLAKAFGLDDRDTAVEELAKQAEAGEVQKLEGFGEKSEAQILEAIRQSKMTKNEKPRMLWSQAEQVVVRLQEYMRECAAVKDVDALGSYRRKNPTVGDIDLVVSTEDAEAVTKHFLEFEEIGEVLSQGDRKSMVVLKNDTQVDLRISEPAAWGAMLQYGTGSKQHNILLRQFALDKGLSLSEYGIKKKGSDADPVPFETEWEFYKYIGLDYIPPELRHGLDEIELSRDGKLPNLIEVEDIRGDVQLHSIHSSDGTNTIEEIVIKGIQLGYEYVGITDHAPSVQNRGLAEVEKIVADTRAEIEALNKKYPEIKVLHGYEVNILADASVAMPDSLLKELDFALGGIHTSFNQSSEELTARLIAALENPYINAIAHPSNRLLNERDPVDPDWAKVFAACAYEGKAMEINAQPNRLDLPDDLVRECVARAIPLLINTDAHLVEQMDYMRYGVYIARRAGVEKGHVLNTLPFGEFVDGLNLRV